MRTTLSTFISKIQTRILATRLRDILLRIISQEQPGFQKGHGITEQILLGNEMVHWFDRASHAIVKLDMAKYFDRVSWQFLRSIMQRSGFSDLFITLVLNLGSTYFSILVMGYLVVFLRLHTG